MNILCKRIFNLRKSRGVFAWSRAVGLRCEGSNSAISRLAFETGITILLLYSLYFILDHFRINLMCLLHLGTHNLLGKRELIEVRLSLDLVHLRLDLCAKSLIDVVLIASSLASFGAGYIGSCLVLLF